MERPSDALPDLSAKTLLLRAEAEADLLYATVRTLVLGVFWILFLAAGDGHHHDLLTAWALAGYSLLTMLSWVAVWFRWTGRAFVLVCVTVDVLLAATLLAGLALAADMPTSRLFALPASGLVFLLVAHAALRFNASTVLYAGATTVGVLAIIMAAPHWRPFEPLHGYHVPMADYWPVLPLATLALTTLVLWFVARRTHAQRDVRALRAGIGHDPELRQLPVDHAPEAEAHERLERRGAGVARGVDVALAEERLHARVRVLQVRAGVALERDHLVPVERVVAEPVLPEVGVLHGADADDAPGALEQAVADEVVTRAFEKVAKEDGAREDLRNGALLADVWARYKVL